MSLADELAQIGLAGELADIRRRLKVLEEKVSDD